MNKSQPARTDGMDIPTPLSDDLNRLLEWLALIASGGFCVAFSGGVDSALLLAACAKTGGRVIAVTLHSPLHHPGEPGEAAAFADALGVERQLIELSDIPEPIVDNPPDRCYLCKRELFGRVLKLAEENGVAQVLDGTNADDLNVYRPGRRALKELGILSPLAELGFSKSQVRQMARELGLEVASKPSAPCLATRFPYGTRLRPELLSQAGQIEDAVKALGAEVARARIHGDTVRLEVSPGDFGLLIAARDKLAALCKAQGFLYVTLDLEGFRSGSMDLPLEEPAASGRE